MPTLRGTDCCKRDLDRTVRPHRAVRRLRPDRRRGHGSRRRRRPDRVNGR